MLKAIKQLSGLVRKGDLRWLQEKGEVGVFDECRVTRDPVGHKMVTNWITSFGMD